MCLICIDFQKQRMTLDDARRAFGEMVVTMDPEHAEEVERMLKEAEERKRNEPLPSPIVSLPTRS